MTKYQVLINNGRYRFGDWGEPLTNDGIGAERVWQAISETIPTEELLPEQGQEAYGTSLAKHKADNDFNRDALLARLWEPYQQKWEDLPDDSLNELLNAAVNAGFIDDFELAELEDED